MSELNAFLDKQGLTHYDSKLKTVVAGQMTIEGPASFAGFRFTSTITFLPTISSGL